MYVTMGLVDIVKPGPAASYATELKFHTREPIVEVNNTVLVRCHRKTAISGGTRDRYQHIHYHTQNTASLQRPCAVGRDSLA